MNSTRQLGDTPDQDDNGDRAVVERVVTRQVLNARQESTLRNSCARYVALSSFASSAFHRFKSDVARLRLAATVVGVVLATTIVFLALRSGDPADHAKKPEQLINAVASLNDEPKVIRTDDVGTTITLFSKKYDWADHKRVQAAIWDLSQDESDELWKRLTEHFDDKQYSFSYGEQGLWAETWSVGDICRAMAWDRLLCAYLQFLQPGKTAPMGGDSPNSVPEVSKDFLPRKLQLELHKPSVFGEQSSSTPHGPDVFGTWCKTRKDRALYELQIEMCEWAIKAVENSRIAAETPKSRFTKAVKKRIDLLRETKQTIVDHSVFASPIWRARLYPFDAEDAGQGWKDYNGRNR